MDVEKEAQKTPLSNLSVFSYIPPRRTEPKEMSYFYRESQETEITMFDRVYNQAEGFDRKLHRDDRKHWKATGLDVLNEEKARVVPVLTSSEYGRRVSTEHSGRRHARVARMNAEFFTKNGIIWNVAEGYGSVTPF
ncbi:cilia- and flagella-associated protein 90 isoform X2 [Eucyclogobius newberryi]|uniref:cilia- and flagella-associated protein 90 isoform X2 n=1 Tax=Eucyclogobius newberryi TaxID=166745 RepID=UPI003B5971C3